MLQMLQQILQSLLEFLTDFILIHPRIFCSIIGVFGALLLIAFVVVINMLGGGTY